MGNWLMVVESNCKDPAREPEFTDWYDNIHFPDILETRGFKKATRYEITQPGEGRGKYLATYEIETDDLDTLMAAHGANHVKKVAEGRITDLIEVVTRGIYRQVHSLPGKV